MDYPISVVGVNLSGGKFTNGDPINNIPPSLDPAQWANQVTDELLAVIAAFGLTKSEADSTQLLQALKLLQGSDVLYNKTVHTTVANGSPVFWDSINARYDLAKADGTSAANFIGFAKNVAAGKADIVIGGYVSGLTGLTVGQVYLSDATAGILTTTMTSVSVGVAVSTTEILLRPGMDAFFKAMQQGSPYVSAAGGTADAITASYKPKITALTDGMPLYVRAAAANTSTTPTFTPNSGTIAADAIVKGAGSPLAPGDIAGAGHWLELQRDATLGKWVLQNPATGLTAYASLALTQLWTKAQRGQVLALTDAASIAVDLSLSNNFSVTLAGNRTLATPTNVAQGQSGIIAVTQDATGSRTLAYGANYKFAGGTAPALTTTANATDYLCYYAETATRIYISAIKDVK